MAEVALTESGTRPLLRPVAMVVEAIVVLAIILNILITFTNTVVRYLSGQDFPWAQDIWAILLSIITFLGAPSYFRRSAGMA